MNLRIRGVVWGGKLTEALLDRDPYPSPPVHLYIPIGYLKGTRETYECLEGYQ